MVWVYIKKMNSLCGPPWGSGGPPWGGGCPVGSASDQLDLALLPDERLPAALLGAFRRFGPAWGRWVRLQLTDARLSPERLQLLGALAQADRPLMMRELAAQLGTTPRAVTALVDGLEGDELVRRSAHPTDRRSILVQLTTAGGALLHEAGAGLGRAAEVFSVLPADDQRALLDLLGRLTLALAEQEPVQAGRSPLASGST